MKRYLQIFFFLIVYSSLPAQTFSSPESVEYDAANQRWIVGQNGSGQIHVLSPLSNTLIPFASGIASGPHGLEILGNVLYCCDGPRILGYNLGTGAQVMNLNLGATFLNGLTTDGTNTLFATDFTAKRIYRINVTTQTFNIMASGFPKTPNGIIYDGSNNRCVFVTWGTAAPVQAMSLNDSTISTVTSTALNNCDGITYDANGNWYITAWGNSSLNRFNATFTVGPIIVMPGLSGPADIDINFNNDSIGIPNSGNANNVVFYTIPSTTGIVPVPGLSFKVGPIPANDAVVITVDEPILDGTVTLYDLSGKSLANSEFNGLVKTLYREKLPAGFYFLEVKNDSGEKVMVMKVCFY